MNNTNAANRGVFLPSIVALFAGAATVLGFAPFSVYPLPVIALALLFWLWSRAASPRTAFFVGWAFGLGYFLCGVSWIYVSLHNFGAMPLPLAALATFLFCAFLALFPATVGYAFAKVHLPVGLKLSLFAPAAWTLIEWTRGWIFTGFPWLALGYSQVPAGPLAGYAPLIGVFGITLVLAVISGLLALLIRAICARQNIFTHAPLYIAAAIALLGWGLKQIEWTSPTGSSTSVSLLQGNVAQDMKWREDRMLATLAAYRNMTLASNSQLIVLPETALPLFLHQVPADYLDSLAAHARANNGSVLIGVPERLSPGEYFNSVVALGSGAAQVYRKSHLVPFGEFIPLRPVLAWIVNVLAIPLQDFSRGATDQQPLNVAGQRVAVNICYEDAFGEEIIRQLPQATLLVNASNVAWFGRSIAPQQHLQISQARALETGRYMLRATNTGITAVIDQHGYVVKAAPEFTTATVTHTVPGYQGTTPYVRWGNDAMLVLAAAMLALAWAMRRKSL
jgi:apolipoprotein N-acyltransferase